MKKLTILFFCLNVGCLRAQSIDSPNVLLIFIDDLDFNEIGYYNKGVLTPNIDSLIKTSIEFKNAYVTSAVCTPSRFSLLTGLNASRSSSLKPRYNDSELPNIQWNTHLREHENIASLLNESMYTGVVGKWHLGAKPHSGYDTKDDPHDPNIKVKLLNDYLLMQREIKSKGFDYADAIYHGNPSEHPLDALDFHNTEWITSKGIEFLHKGISSGQPFFLYYSTTVPHGPDPVESMRKAEYVTPIGILNPADILQSGMLTREEIFSLAAGRAKIKPDMTWLDNGIGALFQKLKQSGQYDNTMIILMSDHQSRGKFANYEGARVPLVIKPPNWNSQHVERFELVANIDILPTILSATGVRKETHKFDGKDLTPLFKEDNSQEEVRLQLLLEIGYSKAVVNTDGLKLIVNKYPSDLLDSAAANNSQLTHNGEFYPAKEVKYGVNTLFPNYFDRIQLYDLKCDPKEQTNLIDQLDYSLNAHNLYNRMKTELFKLPHHYSEYMNSCFPLNARISHHQPNLKIFEILDSISLSSIDTLLFKTTEVVSDTVEFGFVILDSTFQDLELDLMIFPDWLDLIDKHIAVGNNEFSIRFLNKKNYSENENLISIQFRNGNKKLVYKTFVSAFMEDLFPGGQNTNICIYPNPTYDYLIVNSKQELQIKLFDSKGTAIPILVESNRVDLRRVKNGSYIIKVFTKNGQLLRTQKIVKL